MNDFKVGFIGLGLIGGSIAKALKYFYPGVHITAHTRSIETSRYALSEGIIDDACTEIGNAYGECDYIFLCAPVEANVAYLQTLKPFLKEDCILTDVGSTKTDIHEHINALGMQKNFIGGHPMAGSEKTGLSNATAYLLENAYYILTPTAQVDDRYVRELRDFIASLGAIPMVLGYDTHDTATAAISHLPHVIASALVNLIEQSDDKYGTMKTIAAGGFKDITRIASSSPVMWEEICLSNREKLLMMLDAYQKSLSAIRQRIEHSDGDGIHNFFQSAKDYRDSLAVTPKGLYKAVFELYCDLIDEAGGIATIATILASNNLSIKNIGIIHNREFEEGVLKIEMYDKASYERTIALLRKYHYTVYER